MSLDLPPPAFPALPRQERLVTGSATDVSTQRADVQGLTLLHKPVPLLELRAAVRQALENPRPEPSRGVTSGLPHKTASPRCDSQQTGGI